MKRNLLPLLLLSPILGLGACGDGPSPHAGNGGDKTSNALQVDGAMMRFPAEDVRVVMGQLESFESQKVSPFYGKPAWAKDAPAILGDTRQAILCSTPGRFRIDLPASTQPRKLLTAVRQVRPDGKDALRCAVFWQVGEQVRELTAVEIPAASEDWVDLRCTVPMEAGELVFTHLLSAPGLADKVAGPVSWQEPQLQPLAPAMERMPDVLLLSIDTLRADALQHMPYLQGLMARGTQWSEAYVPSNWTLPSMASLFTGLDPAEHGCGRGPFAAQPSGKAEQRDFRGMGSSPTLAEAFLAHGFATAMFHQNPFLETWTGMHRGFQRYVRTADRVAAQTGPALDWWADNQGQQRFLSLHYMAPHLPNGEVEALNAMQPEAFFALDVAPDRRREFFDLETAAQEQVRAAYRQAVMELDTELARLIPKLLDGSREWRVLIYVDHGEEHWDSGAFEHGFTFDDSVVRVPLAYIGGEAAVPETIDGVVAAHEGGCYLLEQLEIEYGLPASHLGPQQAGTREVHVGYPLYRTETGGRTWNPESRAWEDRPFTGKGSPGPAAEIDPWTATRLAEMGYAEEQ